MKSSLNHSILKLFCVFTFLVGFCDTAYSLSCKDHIKPELFSKRPAISSGFHARTYAEILINKNPSEVQAWFDNVPPEKIIHTTGSVAGIAATKNVAGTTWGKPGSQRFVCYEDKETSFEQVLENVPGKVFRYQLWDFTTERSFAFKYAIAEFTVIPKDENHSILRWNFSFKPSSFIFNIPLKQYLENTFNAHMQHGLINIKHLLES